MNEDLVSKQKYSDFDSEIIPHISALKNYALKITGNPDESEDILQETLFKAFRFFNKYEKGSNAKAWLFKIMQNSFINSYRHKIKQPSKVNYDDVQNFYENIKAEEVKTVHFKQDSFSNAFDDEILKVLSKLPDNFRTIIILCDIEGYSYKEVSDFVDCPIGTIRSRLHRTRKILYAMLYNYAKNNGYVRSEFKIMNSTL